ncbi:phenolic glucoside malonyltransferase 1-like [Ziziphus jujuba]|uniref:Phenolic glucoside malonyltransferase 1-like n=1 Tax=Ziziphus jujuba TaxID=326968 RepID=A0A6P4A591_ZIZJJ|nr:phenolic glucoside malonyltransferase 1-like [Ziziphus jujuba]
MAKPNSIKIHDVSTVVPPPDSPYSTTPNSLPLTFLDLFWLRFSPTHRIYFYQSPISTAAFFDSVVPKLKKSLSLALSYFLPLTGHLIWPESSYTPLIHYAQNDGVPFTVAESDADFNYVSSTDFRDPTVNHPLVPKLSVSSERVSVLALQVTLFPNHGFSIGITTHHGVVDGRISTTFTKVWAQICKSEGGQLPDLKLLYDRSSLKAFNGLESIYVEYCLRNGGRNLQIHQELFSPPDSVRGTFELTRANIQKLRDFVNVELGKNNEAAAPVVHLSTFALTCAYIWTCLVRAEEVSLDVVVLSFNVDGRFRLEPPIPDYFGTCLGVKVAVAETKGILGKGGFVEAVKKISEAIKSIDEGVFKEAANWFPENNTLPPCRIYSLGGSPRFGVYGTDFGWNSPRKVDMTGVDRGGAISLQDRRDGDGGVEIGFVLKKDLMEAFAALFAKGLEDHPF